LAELSAAERSTVLETIGVLERLSDLLNSSDF
jgi:hypothetical protein